MTKIILSTSNLMGGGPSVVRRPTQKSNLEFISGLRNNLSAAQSKPHLQKQHTPDPSQKPDWRSWTSQKGKDVYVPSLDLSSSGLSEKQSVYDVTVKLFFLPNKPASSRCAQTRAAIKLVLETLDTQSIDLLIVSYPGVVYDASATDSRSGGRREPPECGEPVGEAEDVDSMIDTWQCLEEEHDNGVIKRLGVSEFGTDRLEPFLKKARVKPSVNQINVNDACVVPKELITFANQQGVDLLTHNDCTNILPRGTVRELLGREDGGAGILASSDGDGGIAGDVEPQWVIKYTAVVKARGVIENKGYFAMAETVER